MAKTRIYNIKDELLHVFKIRTVPHNLDIDGMIEDMCMADDESHIRMIGLFLYRCLLHDKRCAIIKGAFADFRNAIRNNNRG